MEFYLEKGIFALETNLLYTVIECKDGSIPIGGHVLLQCNDSLSIYFFSQLRNSLESFSIAYSIEVVNISGVL
jgi:hypothetical protein